MPDVRLKLGDWVCPVQSCSEVNFARRDICYKCHARRPGLSQNSSVLRWSQNFAVPPFMKPGDWICTLCGKMNWARRNVCLECGAERSSFQEKVMITTQNDSVAAICNKPSLNRKKRIFSEFLNNYDSENFRNIVSSDLESLNCTKTEKKRVDFGNPNMTTLNCCELWNSYNSHISQIANYSKERYYNKRLYIPQEQSQLLNSFYTEQGDRKKNLNSQEMFRSSLQFDNSTSFNTLISSSTSLLQPETEDFYLKGLKEREAFFPYPKDLIELCISSKSSFKKKIQPFPNYNLACTSMPNNSVNNNLPFIECNWPVRVNNWRSKGNLLDSTSESSFSIINTNHLNLNGPSPSPTSNPLSTIHYGAHKNKGDLGTGIFKT
ncbi:uncharacterized protein ELE39_001384 [Cryptosporidium sp. chipmunk genotype I]|uniref:uncharacterized protein n=1 Tax=Cryptosporidium sp. chipmunk genotype I TaxID=1280935 RepID=UPI00351A9409|nr:hypothetical protein ELE39_001384 [Cryptosporidium sp. chipmunk genotype I]